MQTSQLQASIEAALFMSHKPLSLVRLQELINPEIDIEEFRTAVSNLQGKFFGEDCGIELTEVAGGFQLRTKIEQREIVQRMFALAPLKLTTATLEVLSIVAYNQPVTREDVDKIRGVDSSHLLRVLLDKKLLRIAGRSDDLGKPMIYSTTKEFLELFGLRDLSALPSLRELEEMLPANEVGYNAEDEEAALGVEMEKVVAETAPVNFNDLESLEVFDAALDATFAAQAITEKPTVAIAGENMEAAASVIGGQEELDSAHQRALEEAEAAFGGLPKGPVGNA